MFMAHADAVKAAALGAYDAIGTRSGYAITRVMREFLLGNPGN